MDGVHAPKSKNFNLTLQSYWLNSKKQSNVWEHQSKMLADIKQQSTV